MRKVKAADNPRAKVQILNRLRSTEGHLRAIMQMVEEDRYCIDVLRQTKAVQSALAKVNSLILERHLNHCVPSAIRSNNPDERDRVVTELLDVFESAQAR